MTEQQTTAQQTTAQKLEQLGFTDAIYEPLIARTAKVMHREIDADPDLADRVFDRIRDDLYPFEVHADNFDQLKQNWVKEQATALHAEHAKAWLTPFRVVASLF